eukprot:COSAG04_NODE_14374_length_570_cov_1.541401_1_plen_126_part_01
MDPTRRLRGLAGHLCAGHVCGAALGVEDPPLGSLEGPEPELRAWTCAELGSGIGGAEAAVFPAALSDEHPAVKQFRQWGYVVVLDALAPDCLESNRQVFHSKQAFARQALEAGRATRDVRPGHTAD